MQILGPFYSVKNSMEAGREYRKTVFSVWRFITMTVEEDQTVQIPVQMKTHRRQLEVTRIHAVDRVEDHRTISAQYSLAALSENMREGSNCANTSTDENAPLTSQMKLEVTRIYAVDKVEDHRTISAQHSLAPLSKNLNMREGSNCANTSTLNSPHGLARLGQIFELSSKWCCPTTWMGLVVSRWGQVSC